MNQVASQMEVPPLAPALYLVATPIGNLRDITLRALDVLKGADIVACEDTRVTRVLLSHYGIPTRTMAYHEHNAASARPKLLKMLSEHKAVALVSDAGTPLISDPGFKLVREVVEAGYDVVPVPGASSVLAGLCLSALPTDRFFFAGFLPNKESAVKSLAQEFASLQSTLVFFDTPNRLAKSIPALASVLGPRPAAVVRELTKKFEEARRGTLTELAEYYTNNAAPKGEVVVVIGAGSSKDTPALPDLESLLRKLMARQSLRDAVAEVTGITGAPKKLVYELALKIRDEG